MDYSKTLIKLLYDKKLTITFAESCTGGLMASTLVSAPGASSVFGFSFVTYSPKAKCRVLGVNPQTIIKNGVYSHNVAYEMVIGAIKRSGADIGISVTGCAGPGNALDGTKEGTVFLGFYINGKVITEKIFLLNYSRNELRKRIVEIAFKKTIRFLQKEM